MKHCTVHTGPKYWSFCDLFLQVSNILQTASWYVSAKMHYQPAVPCIWAFLTADIPIKIGGRCDRQEIYNLSSIIAQVTL